MRKFSLARTHMKVARLTYPFFIENAEWFTPIMALYMYAKVEKDNSNKLKVPVEFSLDTAAEVLKIKPKDIYNAYAACLEKKWFVEVNRVGAWVEVITKE